MQPYIYGAANPVTYSDPTGLCPYTGCWEAFSAWLGGYSEAASIDGVGHGRAVGLAESRARWSYQSQGKKNYPNPRPELGGFETIGSIEDVIVELPDGSRGTFGDYFGLSGAPLLEAIGQATQGTYVEFGGGRFRAYTEGGYAGQIRYLPLPKDSLRRSARNLLFGPTGRAASQRVSAVAQWGGRAFVITGVAFSLADGWEYYEGSGTAARVAGTAGRAGSTLGGAAGGAYLGGQAGAACGPAAWVCVPVGGVAGGVIGAGFTTWLWDQTVGRLFE